MRCWCGRLWFWSKTLYVCCLCFEGRGVGSWRRIFMNIWLLFSKNVCPFHLSFLKKNHPMHSLYCKGSLFMEDFCKLSVPSSMPHTKKQWAFIETVFFPSTHCKKYGNFHSRPPLLRPLTPLTVHFLEVPPELLSGSWNSSFPLRHLLHILHTVLCLTIVRCWSDSHGELNKIVWVFSSIILQRLFL